MSLPRSLTEEEILRYSRQILLRPVGGAGQVKLSDTPVRVEGLPDAAAWLAAAGSPVALAATGAAGFPPPATRRDPLLPHEGVVLAAPLAEALPAEGTVVVAGTNADGRLRVVFGTAGSCRDCLTHACAELSRPLPTAMGLGSALSALAHQRLVLGLEPREGVLGETGNGGLVGRCEALPPCEVHRVLPRGDALTAHLERAWPEEGCGAILRHEASGALRFVPLPNVHPSPRTHYEIPPEAMLSLEREAQREGERLTCFVHSHPDGAAELSAVDISQAAPGGQPLWPGVAYLVVSVGGGKAGPARLFRWKGTGFVGEDVSLG